MDIITEVLLFCTGIQREEIYIPAILATIVLCVGICLFKGIKLGNKLIWLPLLGIVIIILIGDSGWSAKVLMCLMPFVYVAGVHADGKAFRLVELLLIIVVISVIVTCTIEGGRGTGGLLSETNYNIATGVIALGTVVSKKWWIYPIGIIGLFFTGASEGLIAITGLLLILVVNRQWKIIVYSLVIGGIILAIVTPLGVTEKLWYRTSILTEAWLSGDAETGLNNRLEPYKEAIKEVSWLGHGYRPVRLDYSDIHNAALIAMHQVGVIGALLWVWILLYGLVRSSMRRVWLIIGLLSVFDNFMWAQLGLWFWYLAGSTQEQKIE